jgi:hypothetical protein
MNIETRDCNHVGLYKAVYSLFWDYQNENHWFMIFLFLFKDYNSIKQHTPFAKVNCTVTKEKVEQLAWLWMGYTYISI